MGIPEAALKEIIARALAEDIGSGDLTTTATVDAVAECRAEIVAKADGVIAGMPVAKTTFKTLNSGVEFEPLVREGAWVSEGTVVARVAGNARGILTAERTALNFLQRISGIATLTAEYVQAIDGTKARIVDTRKTAPGLRVLDKYAVHAGGGFNHRIGLFDGVLIKDNHLRAAGGVGEAVRRAKTAVHHMVKVEVEVQTLDEVEEALDAEADLILLDNMTLDEIREAVEIIGGRCQTEVSGGISLDTVSATAECGVDFISVGALTHSAPALDLSLEIVDD